jgi:hypothetical protein
MNNKKSKKLRQLAKRVAGDKSKEEIQVVYNKMKSAYKEHKRTK